MQSYEGYTFYDPTAVPCVEYDILEPLGEGGQGMVMRAHQVGYGDLALKLFHSNFARNLEGFEKEARLSIRLSSHTNIVTTFGAGVGYAQEPDGGRYTHPYIAMEYVPDGSLDKRLKTDGRMELPEAIHIMKGVADALLYARQCGWSHHDIKPANVLLGARGSLVSDWGIARLVGADTTTMSTHAPQGTLPYMSPEHYSGKPGARADVYSGMVMFYRMLTGSLPITADSAQAYAIAHLHNAPRPFAEVLESSEQATLHNAEDLIMRGLTKDSRQRLSLQEFADGLAALETERQERAPRHIEVQGTIGKDAARPDVATAPAVTVEDPNSAPDSDASQSDFELSPKAKRRLTVGLASSLGFLVAAVYIGPNVLPSEHSHKNGPAVSQSPKVSPSSSESSSGATPHPSETPTNWPYTLSPGSSGEKIYSDSRMSLTIPPGWEISSATAEDHLIATSGKEYLMVVERVDTADPIDVMTMEELKGLGSIEPNIHGDTDWRSFTYGRCGDLNAKPPVVGSPQPGSVCTHPFYELTPTAEYIKKTPTGYLVFSLTGPTTKSPTQILQSRIFQRVSSTMTTP